MNKFKDFDLELVKRFLIQEKVLFGFLLRETSSTKTEEFWHSLSSQTIQHIFYLKQNIWKI